LLLKLVNGFLRNRIAKKESLVDAVAAANTRLHEKGLVAFDGRNENDRTKAIAVTISVSLDLLSGAKRTRFGELGILPEDSDIPISIVAWLWAETGDFGASDTEDFLNDLYGLSLLLDLDLDQRTFRLYDTIRRYLQNQADDERLVTKHKCLLT